MFTKTPLIAAIDVGTNSFHLVIASINHKDMLEVHIKDKEVVRLGSSSRDMKYLQPEAIERGINTIKRFEQFAKAENAEVRAVATSAVREALNRHEFLDKVKDETGIDIEVITGVEEGRLIYLGAYHALPILPQKTLVIDIGGGSTETVIGHEGNIKYVHSEKLGAIRMTKMFFENTDNIQWSIAKCREFIKGEWAPTFKRLLETGFETMVGTSGTIQSIASVSLAINNEPVPDILNGLVVTREKILDAINKIIDAGTPEKIRKIPGMDPVRADIILGGALILEQAIIGLNIQKLLISSYALREGIVFDTIYKSQALEEYHHLSNIRYNSIYKICRQYNVNTKHAEHIKNLANRIFDDLQPMHKLSYQEQELLEAAALLHDLGYYISEDEHHKHSFYLISHCDMPGFTKDESDLIANIARYHRKSLPKKKHENFQSLTKRKQEILKVLAGILRIAEGLDRRQLQMVRDIKLFFNAKEINIWLQPAQEDVVPDIELWGAERRKALLEETFNKSINFFIE